MWHFNIVHVIKSPNLIDWLYWQFVAMSGENRGNWHTWLMPANLIADIWHARYRRFIRQSRRSAKIAIAASGTPGDFRRSWRSAYKIARCVAGFKPATHLAILYAANLIASENRKGLMRTHLAIFFSDRGDVAVLKPYVIKSPNLMGWL